MNKQILLFGLAVLLAACNKEETKPVDPIFLHGAYIVNEGGYGNNNGSITYINTSKSTATYNLFQQVNNRVAGDVIQSFSVSNNMGFIVANNSQKVEVVDLKTFESLGTILGTDYPRYFLGISETKGYLTDGAFKGNVSVVDLKNFQIVKQIIVGNGPENILQVGEMVYVANSGGWVSDSTVSVISTKVDMVIKTILVGDNPTDLVMDANGDVWVLCKGKVSYDKDWNVVGETASRLIQINASDFSIKKDIEIGTLGDSFNPIRLAINSDGNTLYYLEAEGVYKHSIDDLNPALQVFIEGTYYGLDVDPKDNTIYALKGNGFDADGYAIRYREDGTMIDSIRVGIGPNGAAFN